MRNFSLLLILLIADIAAAQSIMTSGNRRSIVISGSVSKPAEVTTPVVAATPRPVAHPVAVAPTAKSQTSTYVVAFTASWCSPCRSWKSTELPKLQAFGVPVTIVDVDQQPQWGVSSLPSFWIVDRKTRRALRKFTGYTAAVTLRSNETPSPQAKQSQAARYNIYNGGRGSSHENRPSLLLHLMNDGIHAGKYRRIELEALTDQQLDDMHTEDHRGNGQVRTIHQPVQRTTQRSRLPVVNTKWGVIDLETYSRNCNCPMCRGIRSLQSQYRTMSIVAPEAAVPPAQEPTPADTIDQMMDLMPLNSRDVLADLGCGDGRILIEAVLRFGCTGIGVEIDPEMAEKARVRVENEGLSQKIRIITGDVLDFEPSGHGVTAAVTYLYPDLLSKLSDKLKDIAIVASPFHEIHGLGMTQFGDVWIKKPNPEMN